MVVLGTHILLQPYTVTSQAEMCDVVSTVEEVPNAELRAVLLKVTGMLSYIHRDICFCITDLC